MTDLQVGTAVIGGGQAGLAVGYHLMQRGLPFVILDDNNRVGDAWRKRWDSLRLFTPGRYDGLPGMRFPGSPSSYPTKDEAADYLEGYATTFKLPVRTGVTVDKLFKPDARFALICGGDTLFADNVVVATGAYHHPKIPPIAQELNESIVQERISGPRGSKGARGVERRLVHGIHVGLSLDRSLHAHPERCSHSRSRDRRGLSWSLLCRAPVPLFPELGARGRRGTGCTVRRRAHRFRSVLQLIAPPAAAVSPSSSSRHSAQR
jgi:hypothetical protein